MKMSPTQIDAWNAISETKMREVLVAKFAPSTDLAARLLATGDTDLVYKHQDQLWGIGGANLLGALLSEVRELLNQRA